MLKTLSKKAELVPELIKYKVYQNFKFNSDGFDVLNTIEQKNLEEAIESSKGIEYVICEAPLCNGYFYSLYYKKELEWPILKKIALDKISTYDLILMVNHKDDAAYESFGRKENFKASLELQDLIKKEVKDLNPKAEIIEINQSTKLDSLIVKILSL